MEREIISRKYEQILNVSKKIAPYALLFLFTIIANQILFYIGWPSGDDVTYHFANIYDTYDALKNGHSIYISSNLIGGLGYGKGLFYSPLGHFNVAFIGLIYSVFNISLLSALKTTVFLSIYISGIFMYHFMKRFSKNIYLQLAIAFIFIISPYRLFCFFARNAFGEAYATMYIPLFFMGLYDICHIKDNEFSAKGFIETILGATLLYFSHNITALYSYFFGVIYILFFIKPLVKNIINNKRFRIYIVISVSLIIGLCFVLLLNTFTLYNTGLYNVSDPDRMYTNKGHVQNEISRAQNFSGFLNISWLQSYTKNAYTYNTHFLELIYFSLASLFLFATDIFLKRFKIFRRTHNLIASLVYLIAVFIIYKVYTTSFREELVYSAMALIIFYNLATYLKDLKTTYFENKTLIAYILILVINICLITMKSAWDYMLSPFYVIQFAWRLYTFVWVFVPLILGIVIEKEGYKVALVALTASSFIPMLSQVNFEKRLVNESLSSRDDSYETNRSYPYKYSIDERYSKISNAIGHNKEYLPRIYYFYDNKYKTSFSKSLYRDVCDVISNPNVDDRLEPLICSGSGSISNYISDTPHVSFDLKLNQISTVEVPLIHYTGYVLYVTDNSTGKTNQVDLLSPENCDYLVGFTLDGGDYHIDINYKGVKGHSFAVYIFDVSLVGLNLFYLLDSLYLYKRKNIYLY
jgi:hypothetical protein